MNLKETYNRIAEDWAKDHSSDGWWNEGTDKFLSFLPQHGAILDVGCGAGIKAKYLIDKGFEVVGIDFSEKMIDASKQRAPQSNFFVKDIKEKLDFNRQFDGIFAQAVLLHIPKKEIADVVKNITEPLVQNGCFYLAVKELKPGNAEEEIVKEDDYGYEYERFFSYYTVDEIKKILLTTGFEIIFEKVTSSGKTNWIQIIGRKV